MGTGEYDDDGVNDNDDNDDDKDDEDAGADDRRGV